MYEGPALWLGGMTFGTMALGVDLPLNGGETTSKTDGEIPEAAD